MRMLSIVGRSGSGKTTLLVRLIPQLIRGGLRVAALKHSHHGKLEVDRPGKDSYRLREAGAHVVVLLSKGQMVQIESLEQQPSPDEVAARLPHVDLLLVESWKSAGLPCLEVIGDSGARIELADSAESVERSSGSRLAIVADRDPGDGLPCFRRDDVERLAGFVIDWCAGVGRDS